MSETICISPRQGRIRRKRCDCALHIDKITFSQYVVMWLSGYYNGKRNNTIIEPETIKKDEEKVNSYCYQHREMTVMDAVKNVLGFEK